MPSDPEQEYVQDVWYGQIVTIVSRWFLIGAALVLTLWRAQEIGDITSVIYLLLVLVALNFVLHGRFITGSPMRRQVIIASCLMDAAIISLVILTARWNAERGIDNPFYVFYYPVLLSFALVFPLRLTAPFTLLVIGSYSTIVVAATPGFAIGDSVETLTARIVTMATVAILGAMYWRIQRTWRHQRYASSIGS